MKYEEINDNVTLKEYVDLFIKSYCNDDWDRNNPFKEEIEAIDIYLRYKYIQNGKTYPLKMKVKDIPITEEEHIRLKEVFGIHLETLFELLLAELFILSADFKAQNTFSIEKFKQKFHKIDTFETSEYIRKNFGFLG